MNQLSRGAMKWSRLIGEAQLNRRLPSTLFIPPKLFSTEAVESSHASSSNNQFRTPSSGSVYGRLSITKHTTKSDVINLLEGCQLSPEKLKVEYNPAYIPLSMQISSLVATLASNPTFVSGLYGWAAAQSMKVFLNYCVERRWDFRVMFTSVVICHGVADSLFPVCLGFSLIVMYDAIGVRRHAGMQAQVLNLIIDDLFQGHPISQRKLKELMGHTLSQVFAGALLGILVASVYCRICRFP